MNPNAKLRAARQAAGLCRLCDQPHAPNRTLCEPHLLKQRQQKKAREDARKAAGVCVTGGCGKKAAKGHTRCKKCHAEHVVANREWQRANRNKTTKRVK